ncbi:glycerate kinase type-2 family protein [Paracoccus marinaquae]|uniref:DUF4147 domain-containing protein n=1 Tax=Paracoccus marinaquae TaxID=2841926 RepID=A0ABS6AHR5_9RHOB|nr:DUF4147 domain-containing protein [Paracoccus marinaquae]MBU3030135.1 DUF4147 domain-containing protein [Paracoccus marinaquae]
MEQNPSLRTRAMQLIEAGIGAADPGLSVARAMASVLADPPAPGGAWRLIALGKAARAMAAAALEALPGARALVVTNAGNDAPLERAEILVAGHPVPDAAGESAARRVEALLGGAGAQDRVLALISGGGSAMLPAPLAGISLAEKQQVNRLLLASGADIGQTNLIRQAISRLKGGGWLRICPAPVTALILSDVPGDDLRVIASGPTVAPIGAIAEAAGTARVLGIWDRLPASVQVALSRPEDRPAPPPARNTLVGSNGQSVAAMIAAGAQDGGLPLEGDVEDCARALMAVAAKAPPGAALVFGGETTVRLTGDGLGGRNQELALRFARAAEAAGMGGDWLFASVGSDGRDGPGEAAGGIVDPQTLARMRKAGLDLEDVLARNDSTPALQAAGGLVVTGATGTNVADLAVFLRAGPAV